MMKSRLWLVSYLSFISIIGSMFLALLNEFWLSMPKFSFGIPIMVITHGFLNAIMTIPCFFGAIRLESNENSKLRTTNNHVIFFDGFCVLCSRSVALLIKLDKKRLFKYSSLQGNYAQKVLDLGPIKTDASVVFHSEGLNHKGAEAVIYILIKLDGLNKLAGILLNLFPLFILNWLYNLIAFNRYRIFGKKDSCLIPTEEDKLLFLP